MVRSTFGVNPEDLEPKTFGKLANEAVFLKQLDFKLMKNTIKTAISELFSNE